MVKISDVAALAGVSPAAVSRALSGDKTLRVSEATRARVFDAARKLDYVPNHAGRSLRTARSGTLALIVPDVTSAVFAELAAGAEEEAATRDMAIVLGRSESLLGGGTRARLERMISQARIDGVILQSPEAVRPEDLADLGGRGTPVVVINSTHGGPLSTIVLDDQAGIRTAVAHLCALGHTRIGFIGGLPTNDTASRREAGFRAGLSDAGLRPDEEGMTRVGYSGSDGRVAIDLLLVKGPLPSALVVASLNAALGVLAAIHSRGFRVPADVSIVALHDVWYADATWPPITTVRMPLRELGAAAVVRVVNRASDVTHTTIRRPKPVLTVRQSTTVPPKHATAPVEEGAD